MAGRRSCPWALTVLISKDTFKVVDNLSGSMMRCRVNQNLFDFFPGKVICMHVGLVFLFLALGFIQLLIFFFLVVTTLMLIQVKIFVIFPRQPHHSLRMWRAPVGCNDCFNFSKQNALQTGWIFTASSVVHYSNSFSSSLQLALVFKSWKHVGRELPKYLWTIAGVRVTRAPNEIKDLHHETKRLINHSVPSWFCCLKKSFS